MAAKFTRLPAELLDGIASQVPVTDLLTLCRTNHALYDVSLRWIYHTISPTTLAGAVKVLKVLTSNQAAAACVKVLDIHLEFDGVLKSFTRLMKMALVKLTSLTSLNLSFLPNSFSFFAHTRFPRLRDCQIPFCADTAAFLRLHPTLVKLIVLPDFVPVNPTHPPSPISLPHLRDFSGPALMARQVVPHSPIELVTLSWDRSLDEMYHHVLGAFSRMHEPPRVMSNLVSTWDPALLLAIAKHLPHLTVLNIWKLTTHTGEGTLTGFYDALKTAILDLPHLFTFSFTRIGDDAPPTLADLALEFSAVRELGSRSATLHVCTFASNTTWYRIKENFWYPSAANKNMAESEWRVRWLVRGAVETPAEFPGYAEEMEKGLGKARWTELINKLGPSAE
ncbi:hypothetical protein B0H16DRAFT_1807440 [Mycena metata]|uniref:F-box domain-containing protein n=1 Tax=Mycena metata TaxID=1033252 RepID=A0AAD7JHC5_9AGAR|nr:hypothetical protein B0H16DRAFT_1807440 [Mycena metata]